MREIKFRAWDIDSKKMFFASELRWRTNGEFLGAGDTWFTEEGLAPAEKWSFNVMQYTGLKDKNGKDIYEGDILKGKFNGSVVWTGDRYNNGWSDYWNESEVIGNIHENTELLSSN